MGNLAVPQLTQGQAAPEVTANDATNALDLALSDTFVVDGTGGNVTVTALQYERAMRFFCQNTDGVKAAQTLTNDGTNVSNGDTVTIGTKVYTFQTVLTNVDGNVFIGASNTASMTNLFNAINLGAGAGTTYAAATTANSAGVTATNPTGTTVVVTVKVAGTAGNSIATTETSTHLSFGAATLTGGTAGRTITLPAVKRLAYFVMDSVTNTEPATLVAGSTQVPLVPGNHYLAYTDGTANGLAVVAVGNGAAGLVPFDLGMFVPGTLVNSQLVLRFNVVRSFTLPLNLAGSKATGSVASTGTVSFTIKQNGSSIGSITFTTSVTATFTFAAAVTFAVGDIISIVAPVAADATLADVAINLMGAR